MPCGGRSFSQSDAGAGLTRVHSLICVFGHPRQGLYQPGLLLQQYKLLPHIQACLLRPATLRSGTTAAGDISHRGAHRGAGTLRQHRNSWTIHKQQEERTSRMPCFSAASRSCASSSGVQSPWLAQAQKLCHWVLQLSGALPMSAPTFCQPRQGRASASCMRSGPAAPAVGMAAGAEYSCMMMMVMMMMMLVQSCCECYQASVPRSGSRRHALVRVKCRRYTPERCAAGSSNRKATTVTCGGIPAAPEASIEGTACRAASTAERCTEPPSLSPPSRGFMLLSQAMVCTPHLSRSLQASAEQ